MLQPGKLQRGGVGLVWDDDNNMQKYKIIKVLGDGSFGTVYEAVNSKTNEVVAIKKFKRSYSSWQECLQLREIKSLRKIMHPNIIKLHEVLLVKSELHLVFQYLDNNLYQQYTQKRNHAQPFAEEQIKYILFQIANGLAHMHKHGFFHRDLKPENLLILDQIVKICDFGLARQIRSRPPFTEYVSTRWYRAPELLLRSTNYNSPVDVFAFGCIAAELYNLTPLFPGNNQIDQLNKIVKVLGTPHQAEWSEGYKLSKATGYTFPQQKGVALEAIIPSASSQAIDMIRKTLKFSSRQRITMCELLKHQYFKGLRLPESNSPLKPKEVVFDDKCEGKVLDTAKHEKDLQVFRKTKQQFRKTRRQHALQSDPIRRLEKHFKKQQNVVDDLDSIINQLQDKKAKKPIFHSYKYTKKNNRQTREKFYTELHHHCPEEESPLRYPKKIQSNHEENYSHPQITYNITKPKYEHNSNRNIFGYAFQPSLPSISHLHNPKRIGGQRQRPSYLSTNHKNNILSPILAPLRYS